MKQFLHMLVKIQANKLRQIKTIKTLHQLKDQAYSKAEKGDLSFYYYYSVYLTGYFPVLLQPGSCLSAFLS